MAATHSSYRAATIKLLKWEV